MYHFGANTSTNLHGDVFLLFRDFHLEKRRAPADVGLSERSQAQQHDTRQQHGPAERAKQFVTVVRAGLPVDNGHELVADGDDDLAQFVNDAGRGRHAHDLIVRH